MTHILVCLHGWGGSKESFTELRAALSGSDITVLTPDLPGFGSEPEPKTPWAVDDYADWVTQWIERELSTFHLPPSTRIDLLGHSHGGRIAIKIAARQSNVDSPLSTFHLRHLFLCAAAGIRHPRHFKRIFGLTLAKTGKFLMKIPVISYFAPLGKTLLYKLVRVHDYEQASPIMRQTMILVSREDLRPILKDIHAPTDLFWGTEDGMTPYGDALIMKQAISGSVLHTYPGIRHGVHRDKAQEIGAVIRARMSLA